MVFKKIMCIPATSSPSERDFSIASMTFCQKRTNLNTSKLDSLLVLKSNMEADNINSLPDQHLSLIYLCLHYLHYLKFNIHINSIFILTFVLKIFNIFPNKLNKTNKNNYNNFLDLIFFYPFIVGCVIGTIGALSICYVNIRINLIYM